jgi:hypothetical protein
VEDKAKGNHTGRKRNTPCGFSLPLFIHTGMTLKFTSEKGCDRMGHTDYVHMDFLLILRR